MMFGSARISTKTLAALCRRVAISLDAGIDIRSVWQREAGRMHGPGGHRRIEAVWDSIQRGETVGQALAETGEFFPRLVREIVAVGEQSGRLAEAFAQLADHYEAQVNFHRQFMVALTWPILELVATVVLIGIMIWAPAAIAGAAAKDFLGLGLGNKALVRYVLCVGATALLFAALVHAWRRSLVWKRPIQRLLWYLPGIGGPLRLLAMARLTWAMELTFHTGMDVRRALRLSFESANAVQFTDQVEKIDRAVVGGETLYEAFRDTAAFPPEFVDALHVGEESGKLPEAMGRLSAQYRSRAEAALTASSTIYAFLIWALVAAVIVVVIFQFWSSYFGTIRQAAQPQP